MLQNIEILVWKAHAKINRTNQNDSNKIKLLSIQSYLDQRGTNIHGNQTHSFLLWKIGLFIKQKWKENQQLSCRCAFHKCRNVAKIQFGMNRWTLSAGLQRKRGEESANFLCSPDATRVAKWPDIKWPHAACSGVCIHGMERPRPVPNRLWDV